jgi:hypothetical protein
MQNRHRSRSSKSGNRLLSSNDKRIPFEHMRDNYIDRQARSMIRRHGSLMAAVNHCECIVAHMEYQLSVHGLDSIYFSKYQFYYSVYMNLNDRISLN